MSVAKDFTMSDETYNKLVEQIKIGSWDERMKSYVVLYMFFSVFIFIISVLGLTELGIKTNDSYGFIIESFLVVTMLGISVLPFYIIEKKVRADRMKKGLPIKDNLVEILKQRAIDERVAMEVKAQEKVSPNKDLNYYFELLQKGAITQEEYDVKKAEFLK